MFVAARRRAASGSSSTGCQGYRVSLREIDA
jgi:hypothetical protein